MSLCVYMMYNLKNGLCKSLSLSLSLSQSVCLWVEKSQNLKNNPCWSSELIASDSIDKSMKSLQSEPCFWLCVCGAAGKRRIDAADSSRSSFFSLSQRTNRVLIIHTNDDDDDRRRQKDKEDTHYLKKTSELHVNTKKSDPKICRNNDRTQKRILIIISMLEL